MNSKIPGLEAEDIFVDPDDVTDVDCQTDNGSVLQLGINKFNESSGSAAISDEDETKVNQEESKAKEEIVGA